MSCSSLGPLSCQKRYSQFETLHDQILASHATPSHPNPDLPAGCILPSKRPKMIVSHTDPSFIEERRILLQLYCRRMNSVRDIADSDTFKRFFQSDVLERLVAVPDESFVFEPEAEITQVDIPTARRMSDHVLYKVRQTHPTHTAPQSTKPAQPGVSPVAPWIHVYVCTTDRSV